MLPAIDKYIASLDEDNQSFVQALIPLVLAADENIVLKASFGLPFFGYGKSMFCYIHVDKKTEQPYLSFHNGKYLTHPALDSEGRKLFKLWRLNKDKKIPIKDLKAILKEAVALFKNGTIKFKK